MLQEVLDADRRPRSRGDRDRGAPGQRARRERRAARGHRVRGRASTSTRSRSPSPSPTAVPAPSKRTSPSPGAGTAGPRPTAAGWASSRASPRPGHPPRRRRSARDLVHAHEHPHRTRPAPAAPPDRAAAPGQPRAGPAAPARPRGPRGPAPAPGAGRGARPAPARRARRARRGRVVDEGDGGGRRVARAGPRAGRSSSTWRCPSRRRCAGRSGCSGRRATATAARTSWSWSPTASRWPWRRAGWRRRPAPPRLDGLLAEASELLGSRCRWSWRSPSSAGRGAPARPLVRRVPVRRGHLRLAALTHADEDELPELRAALDPDARPGPPRSCAPCWTSGRGGGGAGAHRHADRRARRGAAVPRRLLGTLLVGRPDGRPHAPEDVVLITDIARRAALAVQNAQSAAAHVAVSQALQQALLPRALPRRPGSTSRRSTCPRAAAPTSAATSTTSSPSTASGSWSRSATSAARAPAPRPAPVSSATCCACWCAAGAGSPMPCTCSTGDDRGRRPAPVLHARRRARAARRRGPAASRSSCSSRATSGRCWSGRTGGPSRSGRSARRSGCCRGAGRGHHAAARARRHAAALHRRRHRAAPRREQFGPDRLLAVAARTAVSPPARSWRRSARPSNGSRRSGDRRRRAARGPRAPRLARRPFRPRHARRMLGRRFEQQEGAALYDRRRRRAALRQWPTVALVAFCLLAGIRPRSRSPGPRRRGVRTGHHRWRAAGAAPPAGPAQLVQVGNTALDLRPLTAGGRSRPQLTMGPVQRNAGAAAVFDADRGPAAATPPSPRSSTGVLDWYLWAGLGLLAFTLVAALAAVGIRSLVVLRRVAHDGLAPPVDPGGAACGPPGGRPSSRSPSRHWRGSAAARWPGAARCKACAGHLARPARRRLPPLPRTGRTTGHRLHRGGHRRLRAARLGGRPCRRAAPPPAPTTPCAAAGTDSLAAEIATSCPPGPQPACPDATVTAGLRGPQDIGEQQVPAQVGVLRQVQGLRSSSSRSANDVGVDEFLRDCYGVPDCADALTRTSDTGWPRSTAPTATCSSTSTTSRAARR